jgi:hypothetical protein
MGLRCVICGMAHLPSERCGSDTEAGLAASARLDRARAALAEAEGRKELPVEDERAREALAGVREAMRRRVAEAPVAKEAFKEAAIHGQAFVEDGRVLKPEEVLAPPEAEGFDRNAYHKAYMKAYMRGWRARKKGRAE